VTIQGGSGTTGSHALLYNFGRPHPDPTFMRDNAADIQCNSIRLLKTLASKLLIL